MKLPLRMLAIFICLGLTADGLLAIHFKDLSQAMASFMGVYAVASVWGLVEPVVRDTRQGEAP